MRSAKRYPPPRASCDAQLMGSHHSPTYVLRALDVASLVSCQRNAWKIHFKHIGKYTRVGLRNAHTGYVIFCDHMETVRSATVAITRLSNFYDFAIVSHYDHMESRVKRRLNAWETKGKSTRNTGGIIMEWNTRTTQVNTRGICRAYRGKGGGGRRARGTNKQTRKFTSNVQWIVPAIAWGKTQWMHIYFPK